MSKKIIFIDRDGTLIEEPEDKQIDCLSKFELKKDVIPALLMLIEAGYALVMVSNQDGMGTEHFPKKDFDKAHNLLLHIFETQGVFF